VGPRRPGGPAAPGLLSPPDAIPLPEPALSGGGIRLRPWRMEDAPRAAEGCQDEEIARWTTVPSPYALEDALAWIDGHEAGRLRGEALDLAVVGEAEGDLLGAIVLKEPWRDGGRGEIGYCTYRWARRRGVASGAVRLLTDWALGELGLARVELLVVVGNDASCRVAESAGYRREGVLRSYRLHRGSRTDMVLYAAVAGGSAAAG
jgi:RimJ/RimL family protein N-acetyltransferase